MNHYILTPEAAPLYGRKAKDLNLVHKDDFWPDIEVDPHGNVIDDGQIVAVPADRALRIVVVPHGPLQVVDRSGIVTLKGKVTIQAFNGSIKVFEQTQDREYQLQETVLATVKGEVIPLGTVDVAAAGMS